jgi:hypothetical protein
MRKILLVAILAVACGAAHAQGMSTAPDPAQAAPAVPAPQAAAPDATAQPTAQPAKPVKKRHARRRETDEEKARRIAAKYGVSW